MKSRFHFDLGLGLGPEAIVVASGVDPYAGVTKDATANIYFPSTSGEWSTFRTAASLVMAAPNSLWLCQEASGNLADSIGANTLTAASLSYQQAAAGFSRKAVSCAVATGAGATLASGAGPNPASTSSLWLGVMAVTAPASTRQVMAAGGALAASEMSLRATATTSVPSLKCAGTATAGAVALVTTLSPVVLRYDRTNSAAKAYTAAEKVTGTYSASVTDGTKGFGNGIVTNAAFSLAYGAMWQGAAAEGSDADLKTLLTAMGFSIAWS